MIVIRQVNEEDAAALSGVVCASIRALCSADHHDDPDLIARWTANKTPEHFVRRMANPNLSTFLALRGGQPAGVGSVRDDGEVLLNYVAPEHRFTGVSRAILACLEAALADKGVLLGRLLSTKTAHRFYRSAGWIDVGNPESSFGVFGHPMEKEIAHRDE